MSKKTAALLKFLAIVAFLAMFSFVLIYLKDPGFF
jgi:hypothetical protein